MTWSSKLSLPFSTRRITANAVNDFVIEPTATAVAGVKGLFEPARSTPYPFENITLLPFTTTTENPGMKFSVMNALQIVVHRTRHRLGKQRKRTE